MKTKILILMLILSAVLLTASTSPRQQVLTGTLQWTRASICGYQDYIYASAPYQRITSAETLEPIYLTGRGFPTRGESAGCSIRVEGYFMKTGMEEYCRVFYVTSSNLSCSLTATTR